MALELLSESSRVLVGNILAGGAPLAVENIEKLNIIPDAALKDILDRLHGRRELLDQRWPAFIVMLTNDPADKVGWKLYDDLYFGFRKQVAESKRNLLSSYDLASFPGTEIRADRIKAILLTGLLIGGTWETHGSVAAPSEASPSSQQEGKNNI